MKENFTYTILLSLMIPSYGFSKSSDLDASELKTVKISSPTRAKDGCNGTPESPNGEDGEHGAPGQDGGHGGNGWGKDGRGGNGGNGGHAD